jgi:hypothetical protein
METIWPFFLITWRYSPEVTAVKTSDPTQEIIVYPYNSKGQGRER